MEIKEANCRLKNRMKVDNLGNIENINSINEFLKKFEKSPELVKELSDERLDKLISYYKKIIANKMGTFPSGDNCPH